VISNPPLSIPLTTSGGGPKYHLPPCKTAHSKTQNCLFSSSDQSSSEADSGQTKMNFEKPREVFLHNELKNKNLSYFFHRFHHLGESKLSFSLIFWILVLSVSVLFLRELFREMETNLVKPKEFFVQNMLIYNKFLHFFP
jgi:hypothetical protein